jgi:hypothetical protein
MTFHSSGLQAWAITDVFGEIQSLSREARCLLRLGNGGRGENLLLLFPHYSKALVFDIKVALSGWPTGRTLMLRPFSGRAVVVRYRVSRRTPSDTVELFWELRSDEVDDAPRCA